MVCNKCNKSLARKNYNNNYNMLQNEVNRVFDNFVDVFEFPLSPAVQSPMVIEPKIEVIENENDIQGSAELPGIDERDIDVEISKDGYLTIKGEKKSNQEEKSKGHYFSERSYGMVERTIQLPSEIDINKVSASFKKGVLKITAPKTEALKDNTKKIEIKAE